ncbi:MAG: hypothetical protein GY710_21205 [Desulfobacteraceae bacterium]|nr:hypothetical protein [Desulfobacteraceae bacterium]
MMIKFNVFGRIYSLQRKGEKWHFFIESGTGIRAKVSDVIIPSELKEHELEEYLDDIYHENASEKYPAVIRLN